MHTLKVKSIRVREVAGEKMKEVEVELGGHGDAHIRKFGFPVDISKDDIEAELKKIVSGLDCDAEHQEMIAGHEAILKEVDELQKEWEGKTFTAS